MSEKLTWFRAKCGSLNILHDAIVEWNPEKEDFEVVQVLDSTWCEDCMERDPMREDEGTPMLGLFDKEKGLSSETVH